MKGVSKGDASKEHVYTSRLGGLLGNVTTPDGKALCVFCLPPSQPIVDRTSSPSSSHARHQLAPIGPDNMNPERDGANLYHCTPGTTRQRHGSHPVPLPPLSTAVPLLSPALFTAHTFSPSALVPFRTLLAHPSPAVSIASRPATQRAKKCGPLHCLLLLLACTWSLLRTRTDVTAPKMRRKSSYPGQVAPHLFS